MNPDQIRQLIKEEVQKTLNDRPFKVLHPSEITPKLIKQRHLEDVTIKRGLAADLPSDGGAVNVLAYFETDTGDLKIWDNNSWLEVTLT